MGSFAVVALVCASGGGLLLATSDSTPVGDASATRSRDRSTQRERSGTDGEDSRRSALVDLVGEVPGPGLAPGEVPIAPPPERFDEPAAPPAPPPAALRTTQFAGVVPSGGVWAVMIGVNDYPGRGFDLRSAVADTHDVNEALARFGVPGDHRLLIRDRQATAGIIRAAADWLVAHAGPDATAVFFYAGHIRRLSAGTQGLVGADGQVVTDGELAARLAGLQAAHTWIGLAGCYAGGFTEVMGPGRVLTAAADANHLAYENEAFGRSYLVEYMVRRAMIQGAAPATVQTAFVYARTALEREYPNRVPLQLDHSSGAVDLHQGRVPGSAGGPSGPPSGGSGGPSGGGGGSPPATTSTTTPPAEPCRQLTLGLVHCGG